MKKRGLGERRPQGRTKELDAYLEVEESKTFIEPKTLRWVLGLVSRERKWAALGLLLVFVSTAATLLEPRILGWIVDELIKARDDSSKRVVQVYRWAAILLGVEVVRAASLFGHGYFFEILGQNVMQRLRSDLLAHLESLKQSTISKTSIGRLVTRVTNDISSINDLFASGFLAIFSNVLVVTGSIVVLFLLNVKLAVAALSVFPLLVWVSVLFSRRLRLAYQNSRSKLSAFNAYLAENISGMRVVQLFNRGELHFSRLSRINSWYADAQLGTTRVFSLFQPAITLASGISVSLVIYFGGLEAAKGSIETGVLVACFTYVLSLFQPLREIADKWNFFLSGFTSAERVMQVFSEKGELDPSQLHLKAPRIAVPFKGEIEFAHVWFSYAEKDPKWVLKDFSLKIRAGEHLGVVGHTGAGKSTLIGLLCRLYTPQKGTIRIDGVDIQEFELRSYRREIGLIQQDVFLFSGTIEENIRMGEPRNTDIDGYLRELCLRSGLTSLSNELSERGLNLSFGQRQVVSFGRIAYQRPSVWVLDEATSNIDTVLEGELDRTMRELGKGKTWITIAHRLSTIREADTIIVLNHGVMVEKGIHHELLKLGGIYAHLNRFQTAGGEELLSRNVNSI